MSLTRRIIFGRHPRRTAVRVIVLAAIAFATFMWVLIPIRTEGPSMRPTYESGTFNLVNRLSYAIAKPSRGDVVAIRLAGPSVVLVKRIVGLPGERIAFSKGNLLVNGQALAEPYVRNRAAWDVAELTLASHEYFVVGDNRGMSVGGHSFGAVDRARILGKVLF